MKMREKLVETFRIIFLVLCAIIIIGTAIGFFIISTKTMDPNTKMNILSISLMGVMISLAIAIWLKGLIIKPLKHILMSKISHDIKGFRYIPDAGLPIQFFEDSGFIRGYDEYCSDNFITGKVENGKDFIVSEILVKQVIVSEDNTRSESILFDGIFGVLDAKKINTFYMDITPDFKNKFANRVFADFKKMLGNKHVVRLENPEFERYFEVFSDNQIEARKIITLEFMEKLLEVRKNVGKNISIIYVGNKIYFFIQHGVLADTRKLLLYGASEKVVKETSKLIQNISEAVELL